MTILIVINKNTLLQLCAHLRGSAIPPIAENAAKKGQTNVIKSNKMDILGPLKRELRIKYSHSKPITAGSLVYLPSFVATFFVSGWSVTTHDNQHKHFTN